jgi:hypothetical protein
MNKPQTAEELDTMVEERRALDAMLPDFEKTSPWGIALRGIARELEAEIGPDNASDNRGSEVAA